jgi:DNA-binding FadR family transcriptional regulator
MKLNHNSELLEYLAAHAPKSGKHLPSLAEFTKELDRSVGLLRFWFESVPAMGLVEIQPGKGIRTL